MEQINLTVIIVGVVAIILTPYTIRLLNRASAWVEANISASELEQLRSIACEVVLYCKQKGLTGERAYREAQRYVYQIATSRGLNIDIDAIVTVLIEAGVFKMKRNITPKIEAIEDFAPIKRTGYETIDLTNRD